MKHWSIRNKVLFCLAVMVLLIVMVGGAGWYGVDRFGKSVDFTLTAAWDTADGVKEVMVHVEREMIILDKVLRSELRKEDANLEPHREETREAIQRARNAGLLDEKELNRLEAAYAEYRSARDVALAAHKTFFDLNENLKAHTARFYNLLTTLEEYADFSVEDAIRVPGAPLGEKVAQRWKQADGSMHILIGYFRQLYFLKRLLGGDLSKEVLEGIRHARQFQETAAGRAFADGGMQDFPLGDYSEQSLAQAYAEEVRENTRQMDDVIAAYQDLDQANKTYRGKAAILLVVLDKAEKIANAEMVRARTPLLALERSAQGVLWLGVVAALGFAFWTSRVLDRQISRPIRSTAAAAARMSAGDFSQRVELDQRDEIGDLGASFNAMSARLQKLVEDLRDRVQTFDLLARNISEAIWVVDDCERLAYVSPSFTRLLGYTEDETRGMDLARVLTQRSLRELQEYRRAGGSGNGTHDTITLEMIPKDGPHIWVECSSTKLQDAFATREGFLGVARDITARRQALEERDLLHAAASNAEEGICIIQGDSRVVYANSACTHILGGPGGSQGGETVTASLVEDSVEVLGRILEQAGKDRAFNGRITTDKDQVLDVSVAPVDDTNGVSLVFVRDVTREASLEGELRQAQKMEAIGTMAGGVAHDFNNLLVPILMNAELLEQSLEAPRDLQRLEKIQRAAKTARELVRRILTFSRSGAGELQLLNLAEVVREAEALVTANLPDNVECMLKLKTQGRMRGDSTQLLQVLMNLYANAVESLREAGGTITVELDELPAGTEGGRLKLQVRDTGSGIAEKDLPRVFDPFFSTRGPGSGTGLGLTVVQAIVRAHSGTIQLRSVPGQGTTAEIRFPLAPTLTS